jgi:hypothetical protein
VAVGRGGVVGVAASVGEAVGGAALVGDEVGVGRAGVAVGMWLVRGASPVWPALVAAAWAGSAANTIRHLRSTGARSGSLKEWSERFMLAVAAAAVLEWLFTR